MADIPLKFLVIGDDSPECRTALYFASRRSAKTGIGLTILAIAEPADFNHWIGVGETMQREAREAAETVLESLAEDAEAVTGARPELLLREGARRDVLTELIDSDKAIAHLILGASDAGEGPGPLVAGLARGKGLFTGRRVPVTVVPGDLTREDIDAIT